MARHGYGFNLDMNKVGALVEALPRTIRLTSQDLLAFAEFLEGAEVGQ